MTLLGIKRCPFSQRLADSSNANESTEEGSCDKADSNLWGAEPVPFEDLPDRVRRYVKSQCLSSHPTHAAMVSLPVAMPGKLPPANYGKPASCNARQAASSKLWQACQLKCQTSCLQQTMASLPVEMPGKLPPANYGKPAS